MTPPGLTHIPLFQAVCIQAADPGCSPASPAWCFSTFWYSRKAPFEFASLLLREAWFGQQAPKAIRFMSVESFPLFLVPSPLFGFPLRCLSFSGNHAPIAHDALPLEDRWNGGQQEADQVANVPPRSRGEGFLLDDSQRSQRWWHSRRLTGIRQSGGWQPRHLRHRPALPTPERPNRPPSSSTVLLPEYFLKNFLTLGSLSTTVPGVLSTIVPVVL